MIVEVIRGLNMGGAETLLYTRLRYAMVHRPDGFSDTVVVNTLASSSFYSEKLEALGVRVVSLKSSNPISGMFELNRVLERLDSSATLIFHSPVATYLEKLRRTLGISRRGAHIDVVHSTQYRGPYRILGALLDRKASVAVAVSDDVATAPTTAHYRRKRTVLAGVDIDAMREWVRDNPHARERFREAERIPKEHQLIVCVGSLIPLKGHRHVINAFADSRMANASLVLVGEGSERASLQSLAEGLGVSDRVKFVGKIPDGWRWTAIADVIAHPSEYEGLPVALMEAAALGTPIVATDVGGIKQILDRGGVGTLVNDQTPDAIADALHRVLGNQPPAAELFGTRATEGSFWSMKRYAAEFYTLVAQMAEMPNRTI